MKTLLTGLMLTAISGSVAFAQTNFYANVTNLWYKGGEFKTNILTFANARLATNTNDIAGLILKAEYNLEFLEVGVISNSYLRVIQVGNTITTTNFAKCWQGRSEMILWLLDIIAENPMTPQQVQTERHKAMLPRKQLPNADLIEALQKDGYFQ